MDVQCSLSSPNPIRNQRTRGSGKSKLIGQTWSRLAPRTCPAPGHEHLPGQLSSGKTASCRELAPPHARRCAAIWQSTGPHPLLLESEESIWSHATAPRSPKEDDQSSKRRKLNRHRSPQNSASAAVGPHEARRCAEDRSSVPSEPTPGMCNAHLPFRTTDQNVGFDAPHSLRGGTSGTSASVCALQLKTKRNQVLPGSTVFMRDEAVLMVSTVQPDSLSTRTIFILA